MNHKPYVRSSGFIKTYIASLALSLLLVSLASVEANTIVFGEFSGVITHSSGQYPFPYAVGTPVSGTFRYDRDLLHGASISGWDPSLKFSIQIDGENFLGFSPTVENGRVIQPPSFGFTVDANGFPDQGNGASSFDLYIAPGGFLGFSAAGYGGSAQAAYSIRGIPDVATTSILLGLACGSLAIARRFARC